MGGVQRGSLEVGRVEYSICGVCTVCVITWGFFYMGIGVRLGGGVMFGVWRVLLITRYLLNQ